MTDLIISGILRKIGYKHYEDFKKDKEYFVFGLGKQSLLNEIIAIISAIDYKNFSDPFFGKVLRDNQKKYIELIQTLVESWNNTIGKETGRFFPIYYNELLFTELKLTFDYSE